MAMLQKLTVALVSVKNSIDIQLYNKIFQTKLNIFQVWYRRV